MPNTPFSDSGRNPTADPDYLKPQYDSKGHQLRVRQAATLLPNETPGMRIYFIVMGALAWGCVVYLIFHLGWPH